MTGTKRVTRGIMCGFTSIRNRTSRLTRRRVKLSIAWGRCRPGLEPLPGSDRRPERIRRFENGPEAVHLKEDEHFHSGPAKEFTIIVNGRPKKVASKTLSFAQVVALAYNPVRTEPGVLYTVAYESRVPKPITRVNCWRVGRSSSKMGWCSLSQKPISRSPDLRGYEEKAITSRSAQASCSSMKSRT